MSHNIDDVNGGVVKLSMGFIVAIIRDMRVERLHSWQVTTAQAFEIQQRLAGQVSRNSEITTLRFIAGVDISGQKAQGMVTAAVSDTQCKGPDQSQRQRVLLPVNHDQGNHILGLSYPLYSASSRPFMDEVSQGPLSLFLWHIIEHRCSC